MNCRGVEKNRRGARRRRVCHRRVSNGCRRPVFKPEMSRGKVPGAVGNDAASSAQSKRVGTGIVHRVTGLRGGSTRDEGRKTAAVGDSGTWAVVNDARDGGTARIRGFWGELGRMGGEWGCSGGSR